MNLKSPRSVIVTTEFCECLKQIVQSDQNYGLRTVLVYKALYLACALGYKCGIRTDEKEPGWLVIAIELPDGIGEIAWHCQGTDLVYDGHSTEEKFARIEKYVSTWY
jgi:hypothetical protein